MNIIELETPLSTEKHIAPKTDDKEPFYITEYGKTFRDTPCYQIRMQSHVACVQYVISGSGIIICNDHIYTASAGDTFLLPEGSDQIYYSNPNNQFERIWLNFKGTLATTLLTVYKLEHTVLFKGVNTLPILEELQTTCQAYTDPTDYKNNTAVLFLKLVQQLAQSPAPVCEPSDTIEQIRLYIDRHVMQNLRIKEIAEQFSFSEEHILRTFKKTYGITPHQYILQSKIRIAMIMLKTTDHSIESIADKLNFSDAHHFSTQFKKLTGYKPTDYRKGIS